MKRFIEWLWEVINTILLILFLTLMIFLFSLNGLCTCWID